MLLIFTPASSPRIEYVFELVFKNELAIDYCLTTDINKFVNWKHEKINYSTSRNGDEFFIKASSLLNEDFIEKKEITVGEKYHSKVLFPNGASCDLGFDVFSGIFYMVSRYEEYLPFTPDEHGRFRAADSLAYQNNFLQDPVVNTWLKILKNILQDRFPALKIKQPVFKAILTYDIDVAFQFKGRSIYRIMGATARDLLRLNWRNIFYRLRTLLNLQKDPWDVYDDLAASLFHNKLDSIFFFLVGDRAKNDRNLTYTHPLMARLVRKILNFSEIGIHPSYTTTAFPEKIAMEKERLEKMSGKKISKSRQHFLKFNLPGTYNSLIAAGIKEDYSMAFPEMPGFRAGTCRPFYFYDITNEKATSLKIFPVTLMEGSFINSQISMDASSRQIFDLINKVKNVQGTFISIWHNHTVSKTPEYRDWRKMHEKMIGEVLKEPGQHK